MAEDQSDQSWFMSFHSTSMKLLGMTSHNFSYLLEFDVDALKTRFKDLFGKTVKLTANLMKNKNGDGHQVIIGDIELDCLTEESASIEKGDIESNCVTEKSPSMEKAIPLTDRLRKRLKTSNTNETPAKQSRN